MAPRAAAGTQDRLAPAREPVARRIGRAAAVVPVLAAVLLAGRAAAQEPAASAADTVPAHATALTIGGYVRGITVLHDRGWELPSLPGMDMPDRTTVSHGQVGRLKWLVEGSGWRAEAHQRLQVRVSSDAAGMAPVGFGVGAAPDRLVDLRTDILTRDRLQAWHDIDRLTLRVQVGGADVTLGRQAITWGTSTLFPVADLWAAFSPFEQETEEKPGIDAARVLFYPRAGIEVDAVLAHRGSADDVSFGVRATRSGAQADVWLGAGKFWRQVMAMGGVTVLLDQSRLRAEVVLPRDLDGDAGFQRPRFTVGAERLGGTWMLGAEYHHNGIGSTRTEEYFDVAADPRLQRGESYFLGRHYVGGVGTWSPDVQNRLTLGLSTLVNVTDPSAAFTPSVTYDLGQATRLSAGALIGAGSRPEVVPAIPFLRPRSEFGLYGNAFFATFSVFF